MLIEYELRRLSIHDFETSLDDLIKTLESYRDEALNDLSPEDRSHKNYQPKAVIEYADCNGYNSSDAIIIKGYRPETQAEQNRRIKTAQKMEKRLKDSKQKQDARDRKEYERLKKKFKDLI